MGVNISASFSKDDRLYNGLDSLADELLEDPHTVRTAIVSYRPKFAKEDFEGGGVRTPTVRILQIEPVTGEAAVDAKRLQMEAFRARTGNPDAPDLLSQLDADQGDDED